MAYFMVLKTETRGGYVTPGELEKIAIRIKEAGGVVIDFRSATCRGYISRRDEVAYICSYSGRFGTGITLRYSTTKSTTYCDKQYIIYKNITKDRITSIIEQVRQEHAYKIKEEQANEKRVNRV